MSYRFKGFGHVVMLSPFWARRHGQGCLGKTDSPTPPVHDLSVSQGLKVRSALAATETNCNMLLRLHLQTCASYSGQITNRAPGNNLHG